MKVLHRIEINFVPKPRMTGRSAIWRGKKYHEFRDLIREQLTYSELPESWHIIFVVQMPNSWSKKKKKEYFQQPHRQTPDRDNLDKGFLDAMFFKNIDGIDDSRVWDGRITKIWGYKSEIIICDIPLFELPCELWQP